MLQRNNRNRTLSLRGAAAMALIVCMLTALALTGCGKSEEKQYESAQELIEQGNFQEATEVLEDLGDYEEASLELQYSQAALALESGDYEGARQAFEALGNFQDSAALAVYAEASRLEAEGEALAAAGRFAEIPDTRDAASRAEGIRQQVYRQATEALDAGDLDTAVPLLASLEDYGDASERLNGAVGSLIHERLSLGDYEGALLVLDTYGDYYTLQKTDAAELPRLESFLDAFVNAYLNFSAGTMESIYGYSLMQPYVEAGSALDYRFKQVTMIGSYSHNNTYNYQGGELLDIFDVEDGYRLAYFRGQAYCFQPAGLKEVDRTFRIMLRDNAAGTVAGSIEDSFYGGAENPSGRPVISGPLPNGELPADEDGDGIIIVDVVKKGFRGTMIVVLDPSRVFCGFPGFYGGNGFLLETLVENYDALGGINAGGFMDDDGGGTGGYPAGLTVVEGTNGPEYYLWTASGASAAIDNNNVLHVGSWTLEEAQEMGFRACASFGPELIVNGLAVYGDQMESGINPRTAIGQREDGAILLLVLDGRQIHSIGASFGDLRDVMLDFGAINACSLDGGSSTVMYFDGEYINSPSSASGTSRYLPNAFLIRK